MVKLVQMAPLVEPQDVLFLKKCGINQSRFVRQAIKAFKNKEWIYTYID